MEDVLDEFCRSILGGVGGGVEVEADVMTECHNFAEDVPVPPGKYVVEIAGQQHEVRAVNVLVSFELSEFEGVSWVIVDVVAHDGAIGVAVGASVAGEEVAVSLERSVGAL